MSPPPESQLSGKNLSHWYYYQPKERVTKIYNDVTSRKKKRIQRVPYTLHNDTELSCALNLLAQSHQPGNHKSRNNRIESSVIRKKLEEIDELRAKILKLQKSFSDEKIKPKVLNKKSSSCFQCAKCRKKSEPEIIVKFPPNSRMKFDQYSTDALLFTSQETLVKCSKTKKNYDKDIQDPDKKSNKHARKRRVINNAIFIPESLSSPPDQIKQLTHKINEQRKEIKDIKSKLEECISLLKEKQSNYMQQSNEFEPKRNSILFDELNFMNCRTSSYETQDEIINSLLQTSQISGFKTPNPMIYSCTCPPNVMCLQKPKKEPQVTNKPPDEATKTPPAADDDTEETDTKLKLTFRRGKLKKPKKGQASETSIDSLKKTDNSKTGISTINDCFLRGDELVMTVSALGPHNMPQDKKRGMNSDIDTLYINSPPNDKQTGNSADKRSSTKKKDTRCCTCSNKTKESGKPCPRQRRNGILRFLSCLCYPCCVN